MGSETPLVGRDRELEMVRRLVADLAAGRGGAVLVEGEAGIGKSRILGEILAEAQSAGVQLLAGASEELERDRPFGALAQALGLTGRSPDPERAALAGLLAGEPLPHVPLSQAPELRFRLLDGIATLVERLAAESPVLLVVDDLHWADPSTVLALNHVAKHLSSLPVGMLGAYRPEPKSTELARLEETVLGSGGSLVHLGPLDAEAVAELATRTLDAEPGPELLRQLEGAGGNPLFLTELLAALGEENAITFDGGSADTHDVTVPASLRLIILRRLSSLPEETIEMLRVASVLGHAFSFGDLAAVTTRTALDLTAPVRQAIAAGILGDSGERLAFRHDLVREAVYFDLPASVRTALHLQIGRSLAAAGAPAVLVASHLSLGAPPGDEQTIEWLRRAAAEAAPTAPTIAAELLGKALDLCPPTGRLRDDVLSEYVWTLAWSGRPGEAETLAREAFARAIPKPVERNLRQALGLVLFLQGRTNESIAEFDVLLADPGLTESERAITLARLALRRLFSGDFPGAEQAALDARETGVRSGNDLAVSEAVGVLSWVADCRGDFARGIALANEAIEAAVRNERSTGTYVQPRLYPQARIYLAAALVDADRFEEADVAFLTGRRLAEEQGAHWSLPIFHIAAGLRRYLAGDWDDAIAEIEAGLSLADEIGTRNGMAFAHSVVAHVLLARDDLEAAEAAVAAAGEEMAISGPAQFRIHWAMRAQALIDEAKGNPEAAFGILNTAWRLVTRVGMLAEHRELGPDVVRMALAVGETERAAAVTEAVEQLAERAGVPSAHAAALRCRGLISGDGTLLQRAAAGYGEAHRAVDEAMSNEEAAIALAAAGDRAGASAALDAALAGYARMGAIRWTSRAEAALRDHGLRRGRHGKRTGKRVGWESLTPTEIEVVRLAATGLTNREIGLRLFISRRTVETHLSHVFGKLGISTRVQLAGEAARAGIASA